jgi:hypothetical protein
MTRRQAELAGATLLVAILSVLVTWPQVTFLSARIVAHQDPFFSIWRLAWIAHALRTQPLHLFDANIFYPARHTLAFSDATLLEGILGTPLLLAGLPPVLVYNLLLLTGIIGSGVAMFLLSRALTGEVGPSLVAAAVFTMLPYRVEHLMHLELQWAMFVPLTFWSLHHAVDRASSRWGAAAGVCFWLQVLACVYYGVFLALLLMVFVPAMLLAGDRGRVRAAVRPLGVALMVAVALTAPFMRPYHAAVQDVGTRDRGEIERYSAQPVNYLSSPPGTVLWGWTAERWGGPELHLYPGVAAVVLALFACARRPRRLVVVYGLVTVVAVDLSFGLHGPGYPWLVDHVAALQGFRSPSRFAILAGGSLAVLSAFGTQAVLRMRPLARWPSWTVAALVVLLATDYAHRAQALTPGNPVEPPDVYKVIRKAAYGVVLELPLPRLASQLPGWEPFYEAWSLWHWKPLANGYSGYYPPEYLEMVERMHEFPDESTITFLRAHDVRYLVVHKALMDQDSYTDLMVRLAAQADVRSWGDYKDTLGTADVFELSSR